ncbi:unnamed protein product [Moneuplotes crassus]|uniref:Uncharacterized protein n=1 Tax=Euplotes crassus TaxID=5936 RepID=A0AAD1XU81_EUPCR|nr:unnamed protein product [Moneuplotes crassus]
MKYTKAVLAIILLLLLSEAIARDLRSSSSSRSSSRSSSKSSSRRRSGYGSSSSTYSGSGESCKGSTFKCVILPIIITLSVILAILAIAGIILFCVYCPKECKRICECLFCCWCQVGSYLCKELKQKCKRTKKKAPSSQTNIKELDDKFKVEEMVQIQKIEAKEEKEQNKEVTLVRNKVFVRTKIPSYIVKGSFSNEFPSESNSTENEPESSFSVQSVEDTSKSDPSASSDSKTSQDSRPAEELV